MSDAEERFPAVLKKLHSENLLSAEVLSDLNALWEVRNRSAVSSDPEREIPEEIFAVTARIVSAITL